ncbi:hypothetical protein HDU76_007946 [Blyttiomyces sp. JEL0837]|nr:hypothetical protein HDU76_007946 [Blyttiomyces sp. JEL0837]
MPLDANTDVVPTDRLSTCMAALQLCDSDTSQSVYPASCEGLLSTPKYGPLQTLYYSIRAMIVSANPFLTRPSTSTVHNDVVVPLEQIFTFVKSHLVSVAPRSLAIYNNDVDVLAAMLKSILTDLNVDSNIVQQATDVYRSSLKLYVRVLCDGTSNLLTGCWFSSYVRDVGHPPTLCPAGSTLAS